MYCCAADNFANPGRKIRRVPGDLPGSRRGPFVEPSQLGKRLPLIIHMLLAFNPGSGLKNQRANPLLGQFVSERTASSARADNDDQGIVIEIKFPWHNGLTRAPLCRSSRYR